MSQKQQTPTTDAHKQAILITSAIAFDNGIAHRFRHLKSGD